MTEIPIPSGPTNKAIIELAYLGIGMSDAMFGRTDEEYSTGMTHLRAMMAEYPFDQLGYDFEVSVPAEKSGIADKWLTAVGYSLAERIGATIGKALSPQFRRVKADAYSKLCAAANVTPTMYYADGTHGGAGRRSRTYMTGLLTSELD